MVEARSKAFELPDEDVEYLEGLGLEWEAVQEGGQKAVVVYGFSLPGQFSPHVVDMYIKIPDDYMSGAALDMFYTYPRVARADGKEIPQYTDTGAFLGKVWQQWSRHRNIQKWRPGEDSIATHTAYMLFALEKEVA